MKIISEFIKKLGFTFSFRRLRRAVILVILFIAIGLVVGGVYELQSSDSSLEKLYKKEIGLIYDLKGKDVIKAQKKDINNDGKKDYVFVTGKTIKSGSGFFDTVIERYEEVSFVIIDSMTDTEMVYDTKGNFAPDIELKEYQDEKNTYYLVSDNSGNVALCKIKNDVMLDINEDQFLDIISNTTQSKFLGYTIYTSRNKENDNILDVKIDNYGKKYLTEYKETVGLDFTDTGLNIDDYRETYLRDNFCTYELRDVNSDGLFEFIGYQYVLYNLTDSNEYKTVGVIQTTFTIDQDKLKYSDVDISLFGLR